ncbi:MULTISPECIES: aminotransferase class III-fold pyridoxal phosphate-dependent enzyme [unclassified Marinobacter]|jgi:glutamate-1-semialdehyde 2,1-aminomutase|uniref:aminotransferase class III-fold pyridoxal phosphate-dependent enzyme n=1 Tax=unclassified Marinobacter TaxID=83889 RepID=UPI0020103A38|nr:MULTISPECIES: aminotransferase class III-fold pyridoxal phosphate-dependent enzyme [unclassified Marinobacter]MCL1478938.1 aminotransferase class III-fold pyridoxal phosphate-dependent enzyme [Marinobacter sp.]MCL1480629.1 aminotransferase class III-fold pyridoxal phosphate-dependent enzyme [Marinobacter sp.]MCL1484191.1 aminotransferase class III-fold pyridoxal phosphate-dependent enzyme [Marinobacter sp.]MCL1487533.1 aminotransferase class III-fold pyridoxal phosphate-dependent enzyme [Mar
MTSIFVFYAVAAMASPYLIYRLAGRLQLSRAKHPSLRGHSNLSRRVARLIPFFSYSEHGFFASDGAPSAVQQQRRQAIQGLQANAERQCAETLAHCRAIQNSVSDMRFTSRYRVPFPYSRQLPDCFLLGSMADETRGSQVRDLDGNWRYDLSGSYGVNVFGYDFYKQCMDEGIAQTKALGPVLGTYHPLIAENVNIIRQVSGLDEVSFHMSGTEAVMQAVRLARYHTGKTHLVRFCGAYHGWWDGVQPGIGNTRKARDVYTLADLSEQTLHVLRTRNDIACVLINPLQAFHPNSDAPSDTALVASDRSNGFDKQRYSEWLTRIRDVCTERGIVLIFDEVFTGFRLAYRGAQEFYGVQADLVTYGKTLGGGLPVGVLAGTQKLMQRFKDNQPVNVSFARGTFNSHPYVMGAMNVFLNRIGQSDIQQQYLESESLWNSRVAQFNQRLESEGLPLRITNIHSILSVLYTLPGRYNWMFQFYLRQAGLELSWTGTGRLIMTYRFTDHDFSQVIERFVSAAHQMQADGWWWQSPELTNKAIKRQFLVDMLTARFPFLAGRLSGPLTTFREESGEELGKASGSGPMTNQRQYSRKVG